MIALLLIPLVFYLLHKLNQSHTQQDQLRQTISQLQQQNKQYEDQQFEHQSIIRYYETESIRLEQDYADKVKRLEERYAKQLELLEVSNCVYQKRDGIMVKKVEEVQRELLLWQRQQDNQPNQKLQQCMSENTAFRIANAEFEELLSQYRQANARLQRELEDQKRTNVQDREKERTMQLQQISETIRNERQAQEERFAVLDQERQKQKAILQTKEKELLHLQQEKQLLVKQQSSEHKQKAQIAEIRRTEFRPIHPQRSAPIPTEKYTTDKTTKWSLAKTADIPDHIRLSKRMPSIYLLYVIANYGRDNQQMGYKIGETRKGVARRIVGVSSQYKAKQHIIVICALAGRTLEDEQFAKKKFGRYKQTLFVTGVEKDEFYYESPEILRHFHTLSQLSPPNSWFNPDYLALLS
jgi:hypothetical protein